jgi:hypothetical protein
MADSILLDGDMVTFNQAFGPAIVLNAQPAKLRATGGDPVYGRKMCVEGDERLVVVPGCAYVAGPFSIPGMGNITILQLNPASVARKTTSLGRKVLLKGLPFIARFQVLAPAMMLMPTGEQIPDTCPIYQGSGTFTCNGPTKQGE